MKARNAGRWAFYVAAVVCGIVLGTAVFEAIAY